MRTPNPMALLQLSNKKEEGQIAAQAGASQGAVWCFDASLLHGASNHCSLGQKHQAYPPGNYVLRVWEETQFGRPCGHGVQSRGAPLRSTTSLKCEEQLLSL